MDTLKVGQIIREPQERDAVHMAIVPINAATALKPGQHVAISDGKAEPFSNRTIGIVDPFLSADVAAGERFWLFLYPGSITSLRHDWTHPAFSNPLPVDAPMDQVKLAAAKRMRAFAQEVGLEYNELLEAAKTYIDHDKYLCDGGRWEGQFLYDTFWPDFEVLTGAVAPEDKRWSFFSCSC